MSEHARLSFSASERWLRCAASVKMTEGIREGGESEAAKEGTFAHKILERSLTDWLLTGSDRIISFDAPEDLPQVDVTEMTGYLQQCMDYVIQRYEAIPGSNKRIRFEARVDLHYLSNRDDLWGTGDIIISTDSYIDVLDLKYGKGIFVGSDTTQNRLYVLGEMCAAMKASKGDVPWVSVRGTIMQPRYADTDGEIFRYEDYYPDELMEWFDKEVLPAAGLTDNPPEPVAGAAQCMFCLAKPTCPAATAKVSSMLTTMPFETSVPENATLIENIVESELGNPDHMDVDRLIAVHDSIPFISGYLKSVSERLRKLLEVRDARLQGKLKLVRANGQNKWDSDDIEDLILELSTGTGRISKKILVKETMISAPQALKLANLKPAQKARLQEHIKKSEGSLSIVPDSDPRQNAFPPIPFEDAGKVAAEQLSEPNFDFL